MSSINPYKIAVPDEKLQQLRQKLEHATFPDELDVSGWDMGVPLDEIKRLVTVWHDHFDWRKQEARLNDTLNHINVRIAVDGFGDLDVHAVHHKSGNCKAIPLLFIHGCMRPEPIVTISEVTELIFFFFRAWQLFGSSQAHSTAHGE